MDSCAYSRAKVTADCGSTNQEDFRLEVIDNFCHSVGIRLSSVLLEFRIVNKDNLVSAVLCQLVSQISDLIADNDCSNLLTKVCCKSFALTYELISNVAEFVVYLLSIDKYALIFFNIHSYSPLSYVIMLDAS